MINPSNTVNRYTYLGIGIIPVKSKRGKGGTSNAKSQDNRVFLEISLSGLTASSIYVITPHISR
jgi:hypothetical protein